MIPHPRLPQVNGEREGDRRHAAGLGAAEVMEACPEVSESRNTDEQSFRHYKTSYRFRVVHRSFAERDVL